MNTEQALALFQELDDIIRCMPDRATIRHETNENIDWLGRACAAINQWDPIKAVFFEGYVRDINQTLASGSTQGIVNTRRMLVQAHHDLRLKLQPSKNLAFDAGEVFEYYDELRKLLELATEEVFFIDPYINAEFISRYLPHIKNGVQVRILASEKIDALISSAQMFTQQYQLALEVKKSDKLHDRYVIIDKQNCYQSGASFKDGAKKSPTAIIEVRDIFESLIQHYENLWHESDSKFKY